jgi:phosphate transport system permease protein
MANAMVGTVMLVAGACAIGVPVGVLGGVYLSEFGRNRFGGWVRFAADVINGVPSIVMGIFTYSLIVLPQKHFSGLSGSFALGIIMIPIVMRTTEEMLRLVPRSQRDASLALGATYSRTTFGVTLPSAMTGIVTGILLGVARVAGETAPLLFTAFGNRFWSFNPNQPVAALPLQIFNYAISPYEDWHRQAWAGALVLVTFSLVINLAARLLLARQMRRA